MAFWYHRYLQFLHIMVNCPHSVLQHEDFAFISEFCFYRFSNRKFLDETFPGGVNWNKNEFGGIFMFLYEPLAKHAHYFAAFETQ